MTDDMKRMMATREVSFFTQFKILKSVLMLHEQELYFERKTCQSKQEHFIFCKQIYLYGSIVRNTLILWISAYPINHMNLHKYLWQLGLGIVEKITPTETLTETMKPLLCASFDWAVNVTHSIVVLTVINIWWKTKIDIWPVGLCFLSAHFNWERLCSI